MKIARTFIRYRRAACAMLLCASGLACTAAEPPSDAHVQRAFRAPGIDHLRYGYTNNNASDLWLYMANHEGNQTIATGQTSIKGTNRFAITDPPYTCHMRVIEGNTTNLYSLFQITTNNIIAGTPLFDETIDATGYDLDAINTGSETFSVVYVEVPDKRTFNLSNVTSDKGAITLSGSEGGKAVLSGCIAQSLRSSVHTLDVTDSEFPEAYSDIGGTDVSLQSTFFNSSSPGFVYSSFAALILRAVGQVSLQNCEIAGQLKLQTSEGAYTLAQCTVFDKMWVIADPTNSLSVQVSHSTLLESDGSDNITYSSVFWGSGRTDLPDNGWLREGPKPGTSPATSGLFKRHPTQAPRRIHPLRSRGMNQYVIGHTVGSMTYGSGFLIRENRPFGMMFDVVSNLETLDGVTYTMHFGGNEYSPAQAFTAQGIAGADIPASGNANRTLNFMIPGKSPGTYAWSLQADFSGMRTDIATPLDNQLASGNVTVQSGFSRPLRIGIIEVVDASGGPLSRAARGALDRHADRLKRDLVTLLPLNPDEVVITRLGEYQFSLSRLSRWLTASLINQLATELHVFFSTFNRTSNTGEHDFLVAVCPLNMLGGADGANMRLRRKVILVDEQNPEAAMHELGHAMGLYTGTLSGEQYKQTGDTGEGRMTYDAGLNLWGFASINSGPYAHNTIPSGGFRNFQYYTPSGVYDIMGAKPSPLWISPTTWGGMTSWLMNNLGQPTAGKMTIMGAPESSRIISLAAFYAWDALNGYRVRPETVQAVELPHATGEAPAAPYEMNLTLQCLDAGNTLIQSLPCRADAAEPTEDDIWTQSFSIPTGTAILRLYQTQTLGGQPTPGVVWLQTLRPDTGDDELTILFDEGTDRYGITFSSSDPEGVKSVMLLVSADQGTQWRHVIPPQSTNHFSIERQSLPGTNLLFRLMTTDGLTTTYSTVRTADVSRVDQPVLEILSPFHGARGETGTVWHLEAALLRGVAAGVSWSSSLAGSLGNTLIVTNRILDPGQHDITCIVNDGSGHAVTASVSVVVGSLTNADLSISSTDIHITGGSPEARHNTIAFGATNTLEVTVKNQGATNLVTVNFYMTPPRGLEILVGSVTNPLGPFDSRRFPASFLADIAGVYTGRVDIAATSIPDPDPANNHVVLIYSNLPPAVLPGAWTVKADDLPVLLPVRAIDPNLQPLTLLVQPNPHVMAVSNEPPGIFFDNGGAPGQYDIHFAATDGQLTSAWHRIKVLVEPPSAPPGITVPDHYDVVVAETFEIPRLTTHPHCVFTGASLTPGLSLGTLSGVVTGTLHEAGLYEQTVSVQNSYGITNWAFTIRSHATAPFFWSAPAFKAARDLAFNYSILADGYPVFSSTNLPSGTQLNPRTGGFTGLMGTEGIWAFTVVASNPVGVATTTVTLTVGPPAPTNDDFADALGLVGSSLTTNSTTEFATREPAEPEHAGAPGIGRSRWWSWTAPTDGLVRIEVAETGAVNYAVSAAYQGDALETLSAVAGARPEAPDWRTVMLWEAVQGTTYRIAVDSYLGMPFTMTLNYPEHPIILAPRSVTGTQLQPLSAQLVVTNGTGTFSAENLPDGLTIDAVTGLISGTPTVYSSMSVPRVGYVTVSNAYGLDRRGVNFNLTSIYKPFFTGSVYATGLVGEAFSYPIAATHASPWSYFAAPLPDGLSVDMETGLISGVPNEEAVLVVRLDCTNFDTGESSSTNLLLTIHRTYSNWITQWGFTPEELADTGISGPDADPDLDGYTNGEEFNADTNPRNATSSLALIGFVPTNGGLRIEWKGGEWATQRLMYRTDLTSTAEPWTVVFTNLPLPTPVTNWLFHAHGTNQQRFYRIKAGR